MSNLTKIARLKRGRAFELREKRDWLTLKDGQAQFEAPATCRGRRGRIDIRIPFEGFSAQVELKCTDWDRMAEHRVQPNLRRHLRQVYRYLDAEFESGRGVCAGIVYAQAPKNDARRRQIEGFYRGNCVQLVWRQR